VEDTGFPLQSGTHSITTIFEVPGLLIRKLTLFATVLLCVAGVFAQTAPPKPRAEARFGSHLPPAAIAAMQSIRPENIEQQVRFLSHDLLEGRGTGQRGGDIAAEYIATQFALYGLKPAGDNGSYLQRCRWLELRREPRRDSRWYPRKGARLGN